MIVLPEQYAILLLVFGIAMIIASITGKVTIKEAEFGSNKRWARIVLGFIGTLLLVLSASSFYKPISCEDKTFPADPEVFVRDHYESIRSKAYHAAWKRLPGELRDNLKVHPDGYQSFRDWFEKINPIMITDTRITSCSELNNVAVKVTYTSEADEFKSLKISVLCQLRWNAQKNYWEFIAIKPI